MKHFFILLLATLFVVGVSQAQFVITNLDKTPATILDSAYRTGTTTTGDIKLDQHRGVRINIAVIDTQNAGATNTPGIAVTVQGKDNVGGGYFTLLASATLITEGVTTSLVVHPDITAVTNLMAKDQAPLYFRLSVATTDTGYVNWKASYEPIR